MDPYQKLAERLDQIPNGFPKTPSGVELKLLAKLFTREEAALASTLSLEGMYAREIASINSLDEPEVKSVLNGMVRKGLIEMKRKEREGIVYCLMPFMVGFYEKQNASIDKEFAELFEAYYKEAFYKIMTVTPSVHRVIPVETSIPVGTDVMPYEKASTYLDEARSWGVLKCICRVQQKLVGKGCDHTVENCMAFSTRPGAFDRAEQIRAISREEALDILAEADREGLVHSTSNTKADVSYICNCCACCCGVLRGMVEYGNTDIIARSDFYAVVDGALCTACEDCLDRCLFGALNMEDGSCTLQKELCVGCGLCISSCPARALSLASKPDAEILPPPDSEKEWREKRAENRMRMAWNQNQ
jgi:Pyruvate/2-oxoacid:ferredoxin oxidoreductase delta subunit